MKLLAIHSVWGDNKKTKAFDLWRIYRPIQMLKKHTDWQIDEQPTLIPEMEKYAKLEDFTTKELEAAVEKLGSYDLIWLTYFSNPTFYTLLKVVQARYGTKFIIDVDDDLFAIKLDNPIWLKLTDENVYHMQCMVRDADYLTCSTEALAQTFRERRTQPPESVNVLPNYISDDYKHEPIDNKDKVVIGYFGGSSHYGDLDNTGIVPALEKIMHEYKNVHVVTCGIPVEQYLPKARYSYHEGAPGTDWVTKVFPELNFDIALGPLEESLFAEGKSHIKWQESTRMGAAFVASNVGPYRELHNGFDALLVNNTTEEWYEALKKLLDRPKLRTEMVKLAQDQLKMWRLELNWRHHKEVLESIHTSGSKILTTATV